MSALDAFKEAFLPHVPAGVSRLAFASFTGSSDAFALAALAQEHPAQPVVAVVPGIPDADRILGDLEAIAPLAPEVRILEFPSGPAGDVSILSRRLKTLGALKAYSISPYPCIVVAPALALEDDSAIPSGELPVATTFAKGDALPLEELAGKLRAAGYARSPEVSSQGEYAIRGGIVDFWSPDSPEAVRVEFFGDEIESIRSFSPASQLSTGALDSASFAPCALPQGAEQPRNAQNTQNTRNLLDFVPSGAILFLLEYQESLAIVSSRLQSLADDGDQSQTVFYSGEPAPEGVMLSSFRTVPLPGFAQFGMAGIRSNKVYADRRARLDSYVATAANAGRTVEEHLDVSGGFETGKLLVVAKSDRLLTTVRSRRRRASALQSVAGERLDAGASIEPGERVVHIDHGIGRYLGTEEIATSRGRSEVFAIEYAGGAKLYVPVTSAHLLSRYVGVRGMEAKLDELDSRKWRKKKDGAEKNVRDLAATLLEVQARRDALPGFASNTELAEIADFEEAFPYEETADQKSAMAEIKSDMAAPRPMDRLICGDAGYGKTELAMRAAFIAAVNGRQTALLAPTTVLAEQHLESFHARFDSFGVVVEGLSRFQTPDSRRRTIERIAAGAVDVVIGTHALLSEKLKFRNLGLVIIDEEQRFGVRHKEHLKRLRTEADILTISATPIPRTLYLSITGARDLSQLRTAPRERTAVETIIRRDTDESILEAVGRELSRGGQVFYLFNRVRGIEDAERRIRSLFPKARISIAHAQMPTEDLAFRMGAFAQGKIDILVCTTIIESGLDITRANTIIVDRADRFGLAELYQIRGRVGRGAKQGYAYLLLPGEGLVDSEARERLAALKRHSGLGAGFDIAMRDLELRGAGNLLGREQSGHIAAVGFQLYCQLLRRAVDRLKGGAASSAQIVETTLNLDFVDLGPAAPDDDSGACLPYDYVEEDSHRLSVYRRLAECAEMGEVRKLGAELRDRFGPLPKAARRLLKLTELRISAAKHGIARIDTIDGKATLYRSGESAPAQIVRLSGSATDARIQELFRLVASTRRSGLQPLETRRSGFQPLDRANCGSD